MSDSSEDERRARRSSTMRSIKRSGTKLESRFAEVLCDVSKASFEVQAKDLPGTPDFVLRDRKLAFFIDSCYWHGCPEHVRMPATNQQYWEPKIATNRERDRRQTTALRFMGWRVERVWEHELRDHKRLIERLRVILGRKPSSGPVDGCRRPSSNHTGMVTDKTDPVQDEFLNALSPKEAALVRILLDAGGAVVPRDRLHRELGAVAARTLDTYVKHIRAKMRAHGIDANSLRTHPGTGYSFQKVAH